MLTREIAIKSAKQLISELRRHGYETEKAFIFGSVAKNGGHKHSDIDLAIWAPGFTGCLSVDYEPIKHILSKYERIELHTFNINDTEKTNPFIKEIQKNCIKLNVS